MFGVCLACVRGVKGCVGVSVSVCVSVRVGVCVQKIGTETIGRREGGIPSIHHGLTSREFFSD